MENYQKTRTLQHPSVCPFSALPPDTPEVRLRDGSKIRHALRYALSRMEAGPRGGAGGQREEAGPRGQREEAGPRGQREEAGPRGQREEAGPRGQREEAGPRGQREETGPRGQREEAGPRGQREEAGLRGQREEAGPPLCRQIVLTASGGGVSKAITCAEVVKRRVPGLHQITRLQFCTVDEVWDPLEAGAGLDSLTVSRKLPSIWILLSRDTLDRSQPGYQEPGRHGALWAHKEDGGGPAGQRPGHKRKKGGGGGGGGGGGRGRGPGRQTGRSREPAKGQS